jgi:hypothetical protein
MLAGFGNGSREFIYGAYLGHSFGTSSNVESAHNITKLLCPTCSEVVNLTGLP